MKRKFALVLLLLVSHFSSLAVWGQSTYVVDRLTDTGEGSGLQGDLRYCLTQATSGEDAITFAVTGTINLTRALPNLATSVIIEGPGADQLTVRRDTGGDYRIFTVTGALTVVISGLTIANGRANQGGGIYVAGGNLTLTDSILSNNQAVGANGANGSPGQPGGNGEPGLGGGIYVAGAGKMEVNSSTLTTNQAIGGPGGGGGSGGPTGRRGGRGAPGLGGGIYVASGIVSINDTTLSNNQATGGTGGHGGPSRGDGGIGGSGAPGDGGGIYVASGTVEVFQSTLSANQSRGGPGGPGGASFSLRGAGGVGGDGGNGLGGGLSVSGGAVEVQHSTLSANQTAGGLPGSGGSGSPPGRAGGAGQGRSGGLSFDMGKLQTHNTILAGNTAQTTAPDLSGDLGSLGYNLIGDSTGGSGFAETDLLDVDPKLGPLQDNGGPTQTHALLADSPAIDAGDNTDAHEFDQRGEGFPRIVNKIIDIGAFEFQGESGARLSAPRSDGRR